MTMFQKQRFENQEVMVDGNSYAQCIFDGSILVFSGGTPPTFERCQFKNIKIELRGEAANTTEYLGSLFQAGMPSDVDTVLNKVESGVMNLPDRPNPPPLENTGENFAQLGVVGGVIAVICIWFVGMYAWGTVLGPMQTLNDGGFLRTEVDFALIPRLPDDLAVEYDTIRDAQLARIDQYAFASTDGDVTIPIDEAIAFMLENDMYAMGDDMADSDESAEDSEDTNDDGESNDSSDESGD
ncbi:MAG: hypothetical protein AAFR81_10705 [Chloroflexota bacterium]